MNNQKIIIALALIVLTVSPVMAAFDSTVSRDRNGERGIELIILNNSLSLRSYLVFYDRTLDITQKLTSGLSGSETLPISGSCAPVNYTVYDNLPAACSGYYNLTYTTHTETVTPGFNYSLLFQKNYVFGADTTQNDTNASITSAILSEILAKLNKTIENYDACLRDKYTIEGNYRALTEISVRNNDSNNQLLICTSNLATCNSEKSAPQAKVAELEQTMKDNENQKFLWGAVALAVGIFGTLYVKGHIGGAKSHKPEDQFNVRQSG